MGARIHSSSCCRHRYSSASTAYRRRTPGRDTEAAHGLRCGDQGAEPGAMVRGVLERSPVRV
ncbi:hypothetical protein ACWEP4_42465 [Streptomyces sp. NPDC004227]